MLLIELEGKVCSSLEDFISLKKMLSECVSQKITNGPVTLSNPNRM